MPSEVVKEFARQNNAFFRYTSAKNSTGVEDLFRLVGTRFLDPSFEEEKFGDSTAERDSVQSKGIKLGDKTKEKSSGCC